VRRRFVWAVVGLALLAALPIARAADVRVSATPNEATAGAGSTTTVALLVAGAPDRAVTLEAKAQPTPGVNVTFEPALLKLGANETQRVLVTIDVARNAKPANVTLVLGVHETSTTTATPQSATTKLLLHILPPLPVAKPGRLGPSEPTATAASTTAAQPPASGPGGSGTALLVAGGAAAAGAATAGAWWGRRRWGLLLAPLYSRLARNRMLESEPRSRLAELVKAEPGITFSEAQRRLGLGAGALTYHTRRLEEAGVLFSSPDGQHRRLFHVGQGRVAPVPPLSERALAELAQAGPTTLAVLATRLGVSKQALHYHVRRMATEGRILSRRVGTELLLEACATPPQG
jgi:DNA-binding MarR family transcriptional regulator